MILFLIRWLKGTVTFIIKGVFPERFIYCCQRSGIRVWNIRPKEEGLTAESYASSYKKLRHCAKSSKVKIRMIEKRGAYVWLHRYRKRKGIIIGAALALIIIIFCSSRVWSIKISGCSQELENSVKYQLMQNGVSIGCRKRKLDIKTLQRSIMLEDERIAWIAINLVGSTAFIEVSEAEMPPDLIDPSETVANIVAECDGQIKYLEVYDGQPLVKVGETVTKGDIIVSGIMEDQYGKKQMKYARAKVIARVNEEMRVAVPLKQSIWQQNGKSKEKHYLLFGDKRIPLSFGGRPSGAYSVSEEKEKLFFWDVLKKSYIPRQLEVQTLTEKQAKEIAMEQLDKRGLNEGDKLISRSRKAHLLNGIYIVTECRDVEKDIAKTMEIEWIK